MITSVVSCFGCLNVRVDWMLGLAISLAGTASLVGTAGDGYLEAIGVRMWAFQVSVAERVERALMAIGF